MALPSSRDLLDAGVHFGHLRKKWNPKMAPYIFMERKGIHLIDLNKTVKELEKAGNAMRNIARSGRKILFVATKKQAKDNVKEMAMKVNMPFVTERWLGGMLTNFATIRKSVKRMQNIDKLMEEDSITKKEKLMLSREKDKMERVLGGIANLNRIPAGIFIVDTVFEHIALAESRKLGLTTFGMVDTNADPTIVDFPVPSNDDASKSIEIVCQYLSNCIKEGLAEHKAGAGREDTGSSRKESTGDRNRRTRGRRRKGGSDEANAQVKKDAPKVEEPKAPETTEPAVQKTEATDQNNSETTT